MTATLTVLTALNVTIAAARLALHYPPAATATPPSPRTSQVRDS